VGLDYSFEFLVRPGEVDAYCTLSLELAGLRLSCARMLLDSDTQALNIGMELMRGGQPLAAAIVWADLARGGMSSAQLWCGLGSALMQCRGRLVRRPFELWAGKVFNRGSVVIAGTGYAETTKNGWRSCRRRRASRCSRTRRSSR
jgi:hypothetical protein